MFGIKIKICLLVLLTSSISYSQCDVTCAIAQCGQINVGFSPGGGIEFCEGTEIVFNNTSAPGFDFFVIEWNDADNTIDTLYDYMPASHIYTVPDSSLCLGNMPISVCFRGVKNCANGQTCASGTYNFSLKVRPKAILNTSPQYCIESAAQLTQSSCNEESYLWNFGNGQTSTEENPSHLYMASGIYNVTLSVYNSCGQDATSLPITIVEDPVAAVNWSPMDNSVCLGQVFTFEDITNQLGTPTTWSIMPNDTSRWMFTDTLMSFSSDLIEVIFKQTGMYTVRLTASNQCGTDVWQEIITVLQSPTANIAPGPRLCIDNASYNPSATYTNAGEIQSYLWEFPGAIPASSSVADPGPIIYTTPGNHTVTLTLQSECGSVATTTTVIVDALPGITMPSIPATYCSGSSPDTLIATPSGGTWSGPGITNPTLGIFNPANVPPGTTVSLVYHVINGTCDAYDTISTTVVASEMVTTTDAQVCEDSPPFQLMATPVGGTWTGTGVTNPSGTFDPNISGAGTFQPVYHYLDNNGCMVDVNANVIIQSFPVISMPDTSVLCNEDIDLLLADALQLTTMPNGGTNEWMFNGTPVDSTINGAGLLGFYDVSVTYTLQACAVTDSAVIEFILATPLIVSPDTTLCIFNGPYLLQSNLPGIWSGPGVNPVSGEVDLIQAGGGNHQYVIQHQPGTSCYQTDTVVLIIQDPGLALNAGPDVSLCFGAVSQFTFPPASPTGGIWQGVGVIDPVSGHVNVDALFLDTSYIYSYCIEDVNLAGCMACDELSLIVHALPDAGFQILGTPCEDLPFTLTVDTCLLTNEYQWNLGDGQMSTLCSVNHTYTSGGDYTILLNVVSEFGCSQVATNNVHVTSPPTADFLLLSDEGCAPFPVQVNNTSAGEIDQYTWIIGQDTVYGFDPGNVIIDGLLTDSLVPVQLIVENGCAVMFHSDSLLVHPYPVVDFGFNADEGCSPLEIDFGNSTQGNPESWFWDLGNGMTTTDSIPAPQTYTTLPDSISLYTIQLIATNECGADTLSQIITVYPPDVTAFIQLDTVIGCQPLMVPTHALATPGSEIGWQVFLNGTQVTGSLDPDPVFVLQDSGWHMIILSAARCGMDFDTAYVEVLPAPKVDFTNDLVICEDAIVHFTNLSQNITNVLWDFGDGNNSPLLHPNHIYADAGTYIVTLMANSVINNCPATKTVPVIVQPKPLISLDQQPASGCPPLSYTFTNTGPTDVNYVWLFGDGTPLDTLYQPTHVYTLSGQYVTEVFAYSDFGCRSDTLVIPVDIFPVPQSAFVILNNRFCARYDTLEIDNLSSGANAYIWLLDEIPALNNSPLIPLDSPGQHTLSLIAENVYGCRDTSMMSFETLPSPIAGFQLSDPSGCTPFLTTLNNQSEYSDQYIWDFGDGNTSTDVSPDHVYVDSGAYTIVLISINSNGCPDDTATGAVTAFPVPAADFSFQKADTCGVPMDVQMTNLTTGGMDYAWDFGDGQTSDLLHPLHQYATDGSFIVTLIAANIHNCRDTATTDVDIYLQPMADFFIPSDRACERDTLLLENNSSDALDYCWRFDGQVISTTPDLVIIPDSQGIYTLTLIAKYNDVCVDSFSLPGGLHVYVKPTADFSYMANIQPNVLGDVQFTNQSTLYDALYWTFGDGESSTEENPFHEYDINRDIEVTLVATNYNGGELTCIDSSVQNIAPEWLVTFYAPNAFSPDHGDSLVSVFKPVGIGLAEYDIAVYSPWGQQVWRSTKIIDQKPAESWNGRIDNEGDILPQGAFSWMARVRFVNGDNRVYKGSVTLLR